MVYVMRLMVRLAMVLVMLSIPVELFLYPRIPERS